MRPVTLTQTNAGSTSWVALGAHLTPGEVSVACHIVSGNPTYTVEYSYQDINYAPDSVFWNISGAPTVTVWPDQTVTGISGVDMVAVTKAPVYAARVTVSGSGVVQATFLQSGIAGP